MTREPFGATGDFVTAPEISQMFGELIGLWAAEVWRLSGAPAPMRLVELGPGRGTLMADALRATRKIPELAGGVEVHLVEKSPRLLEIQRTRLAEYDVLMQWHGSPAGIPSGPAVFVANEFFDALPVQHFVRTEKGWCERLVGLDANGKLSFGLKPHATNEIGVTAPEGSVVEISPKAREIVRAAAGKIAGEGGALLIIDYGYTETQTGETLQAVRNHRFVDPLEAPGECDLTAHVDFAALTREAAAAGARVHGPVTQSSFLLALGIAQRVERLKRNSTRMQAQEIEHALSRLTETTSPTAMGQLFKVMAITPGSVQAAPGFD
jgi:SAM-dependent MidA family methyltransferase